MGFSDRPCYYPLGRTNLATVLGWCQGLGHLTRLTFSLGLASGLARLFFKPYQLPPPPPPPPALVYDERVQGLYRFLNRIRLPRVCSRLVWLGLCRRHMSCDNNDFSVFAPISSSSFSFFGEYPLTVRLVFP